MVVLTVEHSDPERRAKVRGSPDETLPYALMAPGACNIHHGSNVLQVPNQNYKSGVTKAEKPSPPWRIKIRIECLQNILRDESETVGNSPQRCSSPTLNSIYLPITTALYYSTI